MEYFKKQNDFRLYLLFLKIMEIEATMAIMSHLSDAQHLLDVNNKNQDTARQYINLAKMILHEIKRKCPEVSKVYFTDEELDKMWEIVCEKFK